MPYIPPDTLAKIKQIDPYTYLKTYTPSELVRISGNVYRMSQESLQPPQTVDKVSTGAWLQHHSFCQNTNSHIFYIGNSGSSRNSIL